MKKKYTIAAVPAHDLGSVWHLVEHFLEQAVILSEGQDSMESLRSNLEDGVCLLIVIFDNQIIVSANVIRVNSYPTGKKEMIICYVSGKGIKHWIDLLLEQIVLLSKEYDCSEVKITCAWGGWSNILEPRGWKMDHPVMKINL